MNKFAVFVLDSVLFDNRHRQALVSSYKDGDDEEARALGWAKYWDECINDTPLPALTIAAALLNQGVRLVLTSGRPQSMRDLTHEKVCTALLNLGADPRKLSNIDYDLRTSGENYNDKVHAMIYGLQAEGLDLVLALIKNNGLASSLRRAWPLATVCNVSRA